MTEQLSEKQVEILYQAKKTDDPIIVERDTLAAAKEVLGYGLDDVDPAGISLAALVERYEDDGDAAALAQHPATGSGGGGPVSPAADGDADAALADTLSGSQLRDLKQAVKKYKLFDSRDMPNRAADYAERVESLAGCPPEEIEHDELTAE